MRPLAGGHFVKHRARGINVGALVGPLSAQLFWSHVGQGADDFVRLADGNGEVVRGRPLVSTGPGRNPGSSGDRLS